MIPRTGRARQLAAALLVTLPCFAVAPSAAADPNAEGAPTEQAKTPQQPRREPRPVPDYDGRANVPDTSDGALVWTGRVLLFPLYVVSEYVIRRPLGWAVVAAERANLAGVLLDFFTFGPDRNAGLFPTALLDFGFSPSVGLYFFWNDVGVPGHDLRLQAATWGKDWLRLTVAERYELSPGVRIGARFEGWQRPDWLFYGLGPASRKEDAALYSRRDFSGGLRLAVTLPRSSIFEAYADLLDTNFSDSGCCDDPDIGEQIARGAFPSPPGLERGYSLARHGFQIALDSRRPRPAPGSGLRLSGRGEQNFRLSGSGPDQWLRYGATAGGFLDLTGHNRVLGLSVAASFADPVRGDEPIPFTEQVVLGGNAPLRGFLEGRFIDRSALVAKLEYSWPVWVMFDGALTAEAGNVFGEHLAGFAADRARLSFGLGLRAHGRRDHPFEALLGLGTEQLRDGAEVESVRLVFGATNGF